MILPNGWSELMTGLIKSHFVSIPHTAEAAMQERADPLLTGWMSRDLLHQAEHYPTHTRDRTLKFFSKFFRVFCILTP